MGRLQKIPGASCCGPAVGQRTQKSFWTPFVARLRECSHAPRVLCGGLVAKVPSPLPPLRSTGSGTRAEEHFGPLQQLVQFRFGGPLRFVGNTTRIFRPVNQSPSKLKFANGKAAQSCPQVRAALGRKIPILKPLSSPRRNRSRVECCISFLFPATRSRYLSFSFSPKLPEKTRTRSLFLFPKTERSIFTHLSLFLFDKLRNPIRTPFCAQLSPSER